MWKLLATIGLLAIAVFTGVRYVDTFLGQREEELTDRIEELTGDSVQMEFRVAGFEDDATLIELRFYDRNRAEVNLSDTVAIAGTELIIEYAMVEPAYGSTGDYIAFPYRIYSETVAPDAGLELLHFYVRDGVPLTFEDERDPLTPTEGEALSEYIEAIEDGSRDVRRVMFVNERKNRGVWGLRENQIYQVVSRRRGGIEIIEAE